MVEFAGVAAFAAFLPRLAAQVAAAQQAGCAAAAAVVQQEVLATFADGGAGDSGAFPAPAALAAATQQARARRGLAPDTVEVATGALRDGVSASVAPDGRAVVGVADMLVGSGQPGDAVRNLGDVAVAQEDGTATLPQRAMLGIAGYRAAEAAATAFVTPVFAALLGKDGPTAGEARRMAMIEAYRIGVELVLGGDLVPGIEALIPTLALLNGGLEQANATAKALAAGLQAVAQTAAGIGRAAEGLQRLGGAMAAMRQAISGSQAPVGTATPPRGGAAAARQTPAQPGPTLQVAPVAVPVAAAETTATSDRRRPVAALQSARDTLVVRPSNAQALVQAVTVTVSPPVLTVPLVGPANPRLPIESGVPPLRPIQVLAAASAQPAAIAPVPAAAVTGRPGIAAAAILEAVVRPALYKRQPVVEAGLPGPVPAAPRQCGATSMPTQGKANSPARPAAAPPRAAGWTVAQAALVSAARPAATLPPLVERTLRQPAAIEAPAGALPAVQAAVPPWAAVPPAMPRGPRDGMASPPARQGTAAAQPQGFHPQGRQPGPVIEHVTYVQLDERTIARAVTRQQLRMMGGQVSGTLRADPSIAPQYGAHLLES